MTTKILKVGLGISACLLLSVGVVLAKDGSDSVDQQMITAPATSLGSSTGGGGVSVRQNTGGNVQRKFIENDTSSTSNTSFLNKDNLKEFQDSQNKEIDTFRKKKMEEFKHKTQQIREQRKACTDKMKSFMEQRRQQRLELLKSCRPTFSTAEPTNADDAKARAQTAKQLMISCRQKLVEFEKETKKETLNVRTQCFNTERSVLGLSTVIPWNR